MAEINYSNKRTNKVYDRTVCFTFFQDYRNTAKSLEGQFGKEAAYDYYDGLIDYALFATEPQFNGVLEILWPTTKANIEASIERRKQGFRSEDTEKTQKILDYQAKNPTATQREIADATNSSAGKVNKVLQRKRNATPESNADTPTSSTTCHEREHERKCVDEKRRSLKELEDEELNSLLGDFQARIKYSVLYGKYNLEANSLDKNLKEAIEEILAERKAEHEANLLSDYLHSNPFFKNDLIKKIGCTAQELEENAKRLETTPNCLRYYFFDRTSDEPFGIDYYNEHYKEDLAFSDYWDFLKNILYANCEEKDGVWQDKKWGAI